MEDLRERYEKETGESCVTCYDCFSDNYVEWLEDLIYEKEI